MNRLHIIGRKNHGKTTLIVELVRELSRRGLSVATIKHTHHRHELDLPGKDSFRHRTAGAAAVAVLTQSMSAIYLPQPYEEDQSDRYACFEPLFGAYDLVLVEGDVHATAPKIEVWRDGLGSTPIAAEDASVLAVVTDDCPPHRGTLLPRRSVAAIAEWVCREALNSVANG